MRLHSIVASLLLACIASFIASGQTVRVLPYQDESLPIKKRVDDLVSRMTLEEKISQMTNDSAAIPRLDIPAYNWWNEGLHGVARSGYATLFPQAIGMAATWDTELVGRESDVISTEARAKYNEAARDGIHSIYYGLTFWSPNINIFRDPRWGRGQETYGEDPFLTSRLGVAFVEGLQGKDPNYFKIIATPKHFAVHSGPESERHRFDVEPSPRDLWDTYLPAFRATITEAKADSIMCAYNAVDKSPACGNQELLRTILRGEWGFKGYVTSDCGAIDDFFNPDGHRYSPDRENAAVAGVRAGTDTNCGGTYRALAGAVRKGLISEAEVDASVKRLFEARFRLGLFDPAKKVIYSSIPFSEVDSPPHRELALKAARESIVLLKNEDGVLPLRSGIRTIAVIGPNAASLSAIEGNYNAVPKDPVLPVDGIAKEFRNAKILYGQGSPYAEGAPLPVPRTVLHPTMTSTVEGLKAEYFANDSFDGRPAVTRVDRQIDFDWNSASPASGVPADRFAVRWSGAIAVPKEGDYDFQMRLAWCYPCRGEEKFTVLLDGMPVAGFGASEAPESHVQGNQSFKLRFSDIRRHALEVEYLHNAKLYDAGISMEWVPYPEPLKEQAVALARRSDVVVAFVGLSPELEGEEMPIKVQGFSGGDRTSIELPEAQEKLLEALAATGKPLVVVLLNGSALAVNWAQQSAKAILEAWYPGEGGAQAIAETLDGKNNPGGRLPVTFYASTDQLPPFEDYSMAQRTYRYFKGKPLYAFGGGLSYTSFAFSGLKLSTSTLRAGGTLTVEADVRNIGLRAGDEVAELYLIPPQTEVSPSLALQGFKRVHLAPGASAHLVFQLNPRMLSQVNSRGARAVTSGSYLVVVGGSQPDSDGKHLSAEFNIEGTQDIPR